MADKINVTDFTWLRVGLCLLSLGVIMPSQAVTIDIGSGSQEWLGPAISGSFTAPISQFGNHLTMDPFAAVTIYSSCYNNIELTDISGIQALKIAQGIFLVPQITFSITYQLNSGASETMSGTIGKPATSAVVTTSGTSNQAVNIPDKGWCLAPRASTQNNFFKADSQRTGSINGNWIIITDGSQQDGIYDFPSGLFFSNSMYFPSNSASISLQRHQIKVSTRQCSIDINNSIDFGEVEHNSAIGTELGRVSDNLVVGCTQSSVNPAANINVKFQSNSGFYDGEATRLSLNEGGGYITGEIAGIAGIDNGACNSTGGLKFNSDPIRLGSINAGANSESFSNSLTWRLCSGGSTLPVGNVSASATVDVIFN